MKLQTPCLVTLISCLSVMGAHNVLAQAPDMSHGEQVTISSAGPQTYDHDTQTITFLDRARAVRGDVTIDADQLIGFLRKKAVPTQKDGSKAGDKQAKKQDQGAASAKDDKSSSSTDNAMGGSTELYRMEAIGHVHIYSPTDQAWGDRALYDVDQATMVMTGKHLKMSTAQAVMTARDVVEYHTANKMSVGRGNATVTTNDGRRIKADVLVAYGKPDAPSSGPKSKPGAGDNKEGKLDRAYAWGNVVLRTPTETATGDRGVYVFDTELARLVGNVHVTSGQNQNNGQSAIVNVKTGVAIMNPAPGQRVEGLVIPNQTANTKSGPAK